MKTVWAFLLFWACLVSGVVGPAHSRDMRVRSLEIGKKRTELIQKAKLEAETAKKEAQESVKRIMVDRAALLREINALKQKNAQFKADMAILEKGLPDLDERENKIDSELGEILADLQELTRFIRSTAKDLDTLLLQSHQSANSPQRGSVLKGIIKGSKFPGMSEISAIGDLLFDEIRKTGEVRLESGVFIDRSGKEISGDILQLGNFSAAYRLPNETGYLLYSEKSQRFFALSKPPKSQMIRKINAYMDGQSEDVPIDISRGAALRQYTHTLSMAERIRRGGPLIWPILLIGALGFMIIIERLFHLAFKHINADRFMDRIAPLVSQRNWNECRMVCREQLKKPVARVLLAGIEFRDAARTDMENVLQEAILREIPPLERFLSTLGMLAAIAPLLGLLGTVTGMINTFHTITYYGAGDAKMMSGGISEALVTTMLGLSVAIPIMLCHSFLSRRVESIIGKMEEKGVSFINLIYKKEYPFK